MLLSSVLPVKPKPVAEHSEQGVQREVRLARSMNQHNYSDTFGKLNRMIVFINVS